MHMYFASRAIIIVILIIITIVFLEKYPESRLDNVRLSDIMRSTRKDANSLYFQKKRKYPFPRQMLHGSLFL